MQFSVGQLFIGNFVMDQTLKTAKQGRILLAMLHCLRMVRSVLLYHILSLFLTLPDSWRVFSTQHTGSVHVAIMTLTNNYHGLRFKVFFIYLFLKSV